MRRSLLYAVLLVACGKKESTPAPAPAPPPVSSSSVRVGAQAISSEVYRSGARLKIQWAALAGGKVMPVAVFDTKLGRTCVVGSNSCAPAPDDGPRAEDMAFADTKRKEPSLIVDPAECRSPKPNAQDNQLWQVSYAEPHDALFRLDRARIESSRTVATGSGCVVAFTTIANDLCVRPFRRVDPSELEKLAESTEAGLIVAKGTEGSLLPVDKKSDAPTRLEADAGRIVRRVRSLPDGRVVATSFYDTKLERDCTPEKTDDGKWRCTVKMNRNDCQLSSVSDRGAPVEALVPSSTCKGDGCCPAGVVWIPGQPATKPQRFGIDPSDNGHPAVAGRAIRVAPSTRTAAQIRGYLPNWQLPVREKLEDVDVSSFAELELLQDP